MARSDLLKQLFRSFKGRNDNVFLETARQIAEDERKKHHITLADDLIRILDNGVPSTNGSVRGFEQIPKDSDRGAPLLEISRPDRFFADLVLSPNQYEVLKRVISEFRSWEILEASGLRPSNKLLFCGPPGCGKTATAHAASCELSLPLVTIRFDAVVSSLLGETAANLRKVFDFIVRGAWVVLFDEFDAIGRSRDDPTEHGELKRVVNTFLQMLDRFTGHSLVIAATNFEQSLDPALWRRFDEIIRFEKPTRDQIEMLLQMRLKSLKTPVGLVNQSKRLSGLCHADVERICRDILKAAVLEGKRSVSASEIEEAVGRELARRQVLLQSQHFGPGQIDEA